jgi:hypothetical protein
MIQKEKPKPKPIEIFNIPYNDFKQFEQQRRFSIQFEYRTPPEVNQEIVLHCEKSEDNPDNPPAIRTTISNVICLDILLVTKNLYDVVLGFKK